MYTIMLLDDEPILLEGLLDTIDWSAYGFHVITTARHGIEGIQRYIDYQPDAILTDIRMRFMDGLDFIREIRRMDDQTEILVMSAYSNFEYAKTACELGVTDYLLKPLDESILAEVLTKLKVRLDKRFSVMQRLNSIEFYDKERREVIIQAAKRRSILYSVTQDELAYILPDEHNLHILLIANGKEKHEGLLTTPIADIVAEAFTNHVWYSAVMDSGTICTVLTGIDDVSLLSQRIDVALDRIRRMLGIYVTAVLSDTVTKLTMLHNVYILLDEQLQTAQLMGVNGLADAKIVLTLTSSRRHPYDLEYRLIGLIPNGSVEQIKDLFGELLTRSQAGDVYYASAARILFLRMLQRLLELNSTLLPDYQIWVERMESVLRLPLTDSVGALVSLIVRLVSDREGMMNGSIGKYLDNIADETKKFILANLSDPELSLKSAAGHMHISVSYLGRVFKRATGLSFGTFLNEARIERAREQLMNPIVKISDVALEVGYINQSYFFVLFKKQFGITPGEFRAGIAGK